MILGRDPQKALAKLGESTRFFPPHQGGTIVCRDCGTDVKRSATHLECDCGIGFVAQWDQSLGGGFYLGRIVELQPKVVAA